MAMVTHDTSRQTINIESVGKMLGISRTAAYQLARLDQLPVPVIHLGKRMVVSKRAIEELLQLKKDYDVE